jgi:hypothetical protein
MANNLGAFNAQAWSKLLVVALDKINVMISLVNRDYEGEIQNLGDTVQVRTLGSITMGDYTKGQTLTYQDLAPTKEPMTIAAAKFFAFAVDDVDAAQTDLDTIKLYTQRAAVAMNDAVEVKILSQYTKAHTSNRITGASNAAITLDKDNVYSYFVKLRTALSKNNVPQGGRWAVVDPDTTGLLLLAPEFVKNGTAQGVSVASEGTVNGASAGSNRPGFIGRIAGFDVYESNNVPVASGAKYIQAGDSMALAYAAQINKMETLRLQDTFADAVRGLLLHDAEVFAEASKRLAYLKAAA